MNLVDRGFATSHRATLKVAGVDVRYKRGDTYTDADLSAIPAQANAETQGFDGTKFNIRQSDFIIDADDLLFSSVVSEPVDGDIVEQTIGSTVYTFKVLPLFGSGPSWIYHDQARTKIRLHAQLVNETAVA